MKNKFLSIIFLIVCVVSCVFCIMKLPTLKFDSSILSLVPRLESSKVNPAILDTYVKRLDNQVVFVIKEDGSNGKVAKEFIQKLKENPQVDKVIGEVSDNFSNKINQLMGQYAIDFIKADFRDKIVKDNYASSILANLYSGFLAVSTEELENDLLQITRNVSIDLSRGNVFSIKNNLLSTTDSSKNIWYFINVETTTNAYNTTDAKNIALFFNDLISRTQSKYQNTTIYKRGTVFFSDYAATKSQQDINILGTLTLLGVFLFIYLIYKSVVPVFLTVLSVATGLILAFTSVIIFFESINLIIIGLCLSIIGVVCDYTIYFMTLRMDSKENETPFDTIKSMSKPLLLAAGTDVIAYCIILLSPIEPLKQLAVFSMMAITFSCLSVILFEPYLCSRIKRKTLPLSWLFSRYLRLTNLKTFRYACIGTMLALSSTLLYTFSINDNPASFQKMPESLIKQDNFIAKITDQNSSKKFIVIETKNSEDALKVNENLVTKLAKIRDDKVISGFKAIPLNSLDRQKSDCSLVQSKLYKTAIAIDSLGLDLHIRPYVCHNLSLDDFIKSPLGDAYAPLVHSDKTHVALSIIIDGVTSTSLIKDMIQSFNTNQSNVQSHVALIDRHDDFTKTFSTFRELVVYVLLAFEIVLFVIASIRLGFIKGCIATVFSILCITTALSINALCGFSLNLFNELALIVVIGIGVNYTIFFSSNAHRSHSAITAIFTALTTTLITIGILIFSSVNAISSFALTLSTGIICAFILATLLPFMYRGKTHDK